MANDFSVGWGPGNPNFTEDDARFERILEQYRQNVMEQGREWADGVLFSRHPNDASDIADAYDERYGAEDEYVTYEHDVAENGFESDLMDAYHASRRRTSRMYHHPYDESGQWTSESVDLQVGDRFSTVAPYSEVMMHMDLAGKPIEVEILSERAVQIYVDGKPHSFPVTPGEAGIYRQGRRTARAIQRTANGMNALGRRRKSAADVPRPIYMIAADIRRDWGNINFAAAPYLDAMMNLNSLSDSYYSDSAETVVIYFLENARSWSGDSAKSIKAELRAMLKSHQKNGARRRGY